MQNIETMKAATLDALAQHVDVLREQYESRQGDKVFEDEYMAARSVLLERMTAGEQFDDRVSLDRLNSMYREMDLGHLGDIVAQFRETYESAIADRECPHAERLQWERRMQRAEGIYLERTGQSQGRAA